MGKLNIILQRRAGRVGTIPKIWHSMPFFSMTILVVRPRPMHQMTRHQNKKSPTIQEKKKNLIWHPKVGGWRSAYPARARLQLAKLANCPSMWSKFGTPVIFTNFTNFAKHIFLQRFSKKIGNCYKCENVKCENAKNAIFP